MKKILSFLLCLILVSATFSVFASAKTYIKGDVNSDGCIDVSDIALMRAYIVKTREFSDGAVKVGDIDSNGDIDIIDVMLCRGIITGTVKQQTFTYDGDIIKPNPIEPECPVLPSDTRAIWFSFLDYEDCLQGKSEQEFIKSFSKIVNNCKSLEINTLFIHVRSHGDAYYNSKLFPQSESLSGEFNKSVGYDALSVMTEICRKNGLRVHAWINPYRLCTAEQMNSLPDTYLIKQWCLKNSGQVFLYNGRYYLNPAGEGVEDLVAKGVEELLQYDIDGVQIDDYFYITTDESIDKNEFLKSGYKSLSQFRLDTVTKMVKRLNAVTKSGEKPILFGVSPQGSIENDYGQVYADVKLWASSTEYADYLVPQIYFGFKNGVLPFKTCSDSWSELVKNSEVRLLCGLSAYKIGLQDVYAKDGRYEWETDTPVLSRQIQAINQTSGYNGYVYFRYGSLFAPQSDVKSKVQAEISAIKELYP